MKAKDNYYAVLRKLHLFGLVAGVCADPFSHAPFPLIMNHPRLERGPSRSAAGQTRDTWTSFLTQDFERPASRDGSRSVRMRTPFHWMVSVPLLLNGCSRAPAFDIVGSQFPAWMFCGLTGILLAALSRLLLLRLKVAIVFPVLVYPSLAAFFTFLLWLVFFG